MPTVTFLPDDIVVECHAGETIFSVALREGIAVETACVGKGTCGLCRVKIEAGAEHLSEVGATDEKHLGNVYWLTKTRLACQATISQGSAVDVVCRLAPKKKNKSSQDR